MSIYFFIYFIIYSLSLPNLNKDNINFKLIWYFVIFVLVLFVGLRFETAGDWSTYLNIFNYHKTIPLVAIFKEPDLLFYLFNWIFANINLNFTYINIFFSIIFFYSLSKLCLKEENPFFVLFLSWPILIVVIGMGFNRQTAAISFIILSMTVWHNSNFRFFFYILIASLFHKTAIIFLLLYLSKFSFHKVRFYLSLILALFVLYIIIYQYLPGLISAYIGSRVSQGAIFRILLILIPSLFFVIKSDKFNHYLDYKLFKYMAISSFFLMPLFIYNSTIADRIGFYYIPMQIVIIARSISIFQDLFIKKYIFISVSILWFLIFIIWMKYGINSHGWVPYNSILFQ